MKHILIPLDHTASSWKTASCIVSLYPDSGMRFYLFNNLMPEEDEYNDTVVLKPKGQNYYKRFTGLQSSLKANQKIISLRWKGDYVKNVQEAVLEYDIDLIVLSNAKQQSDFVDSYLVFNKDIITRVKCSILLLPEIFYCKKPKQMVVLTDYRFAHRSRATSTLSKFVKDAGAHLNVLQLSKKSNALSTDQISNKSFLQNSLEAISHSFHFVIDKTINEALQFFINVHEVDTVVLFAKHIHLSESLLFSPDHLDNVDYQKHIPLIIHE